MITPMLAVLLTAVACVPTNAEAVSPLGLLIEAAGVDIASNTSWTAATSGPFCRDNRDFYKRRFFRHAGSIFPACRKTVPEITSFSGAVFRHAEFFDFSLTKMS